MYKKINIALLFILLTISSCSLDRNCVCPEYYSPVCGIDGETYPSSCVAECHDVYSYTAGECPIFGIAEVVEVDAFYCGYVLKIEDRWFYPINLPLAYQFNGTIIYVEFVPLNSWTSCGDGFDYQEANILYVEYQ